LLFKRLAYGRTNLAPQLRIAPRFPSRLAACVSQRLTHFRPLLFKRLAYGRTNFTPQIRTAPRLAR
jgi:hypothetical protein